MLKARIALALGDATNAKTLLESIDPKRLNDEQLAEYHLALAAKSALDGDLQGRASNLDAAAEAAQRAHSGTLTTRIDLARVHMTLSDGQIAIAATQLQKIRHQTARLAEVPLRLEWLELEIALALRNHQMNAAQARYHETLPILKNVGRYAYASTLHRLGERAFAGNKLESDSARAAASAALSQLLDDAPAQSRKLLESGMKKRLHEEVGNGHAT